MACLGVLVYVNHRIGTGALTFAGVKLFSTSFESPFFIAMFRDEERKTNLAGLP